MADDGRELGNRTTLGSPRDVKALASASMVTGTTDPAYATIAGYDGDDDLPSNAVVVRSDGWAGVQIEPVGAGSDGGTYSLKIFRRESIGLPQGSVSSVVGYTYDFIADYTVTLGGGTRSTALNGNLIGSSVTVRCAETLVQETTSPFTVTSGGIRFTSPGNDSQGMIVVDTPGHDLVLLFVLDGSNVTSANAFVKRL